MKKVLASLIIQMIALPIMGWGATINGQVTGGVGGVATTDFLSGATVTLISGAGSQATVVGSTTTDPTGQYSFSNVAVGFFQVVVSADGYTPNPSSTVLAINSDTSTIVTNFSLLTSGSNNIPGTASIGGQVTGTTPIAGAQVILRRRGTATGAYVLVDSTITDSLGAFLFSNILSAGANFDVNAYTLVVNLGGYNTFTSGNLTVGDNITLISNIGLTLTSLSPKFYGKTQGLRFSNLGTQLAVDLTASKISRTLAIYSLNGGIRSRIPVAADASRVFVPSAFAPEKGFFFSVK